MFVQRQLDLKPDLPLGTVVDDEQTCNIAVLVVVVVEKEKEQASEERIRLGTAELAGE